MFKKTVFNLKNVNKIDKYTSIRHNIMTTFLILCWSPFCCQISPDPICTKMLAADPLNPVSCKVGPPWIRLVGSAHPMLDWIEIWGIWRSSQQWTGVSMGTLTGLRLCSPIRNKLRCTVYSDTFLSEPALTSWAIWARVACLLDRTTRASLRSPRASVSLGRPWPCRQFTTVPSLDHFW